MKKLFDVLVFGLKTPVYSKKDLLDSGAYGQCEFKTSPPRIVIDQDLKAQDFKITLAHEMLHIMFYRLNIQISPEIEEQLCETCIIPLFDNFEINLPQKLLSLMQKNHPSVQEL